MTEAEVVDRLVEYLNVLIAGISVFFTIVSAYIAAMHYFLRKERFIGRVAAFGFFMFIMALIVVVMNGAMQLHGGLIARLREIDAKEGLTAAGRAALSNATDAAGRGFSLDGMVNLALFAGVVLTIFGIFTLTFLSPLEDDKGRPLPREKQS
jgi:hypothetical protein